MAEPQIMQPEHYTDDEDGRVVGGADLNALVQLNSSEINQQILTAHAYPRSITNFRKNMMERATLDEDVARSCLYVLERGRGQDKKIIEGPSARFSEMVMQTWKNARAGARVIDIGEQFVTAQGAFYDLESNIAVSYEVLRRITNREGVRFGDDMISVTGNAACAIAIRNAILKGVPKPYWHASYLAARATVGGTIETIKAKREKMLGAFKIWGIEPAQIYSLLGVRGHEEVTIDHLIRLGGIHNAIIEKETTVEAAFAPENFASGEAIPPRPKHSDFDRPAAETTKPAVDKPAEQAKPAVEIDASSSPVTVKAADIPVADDAKKRAERRAAEWSDQKKEWETELNAIAKVRAVGDYRDVVDAQLDDPADKKWWSALCDARSKDIMEATRAKK